MSISNTHSSERLQALLSRADIWRASAAAGSNQVLPGSRAGVDTGYCELNKVLLAQGWPLGGLVELQSDKPGVGEWQVLLPALVGKRIVLIGPPYIPYAPALRQAGLDLQHLLIINPPDPAGFLWAAEQVLRSGACDVLLLWEAPRLFNYRALRKLQLAVSESRCLFFLLSSTDCAQQASPALLRIKLLPDSVGLSLMIVKQRGSYAQCRVNLCAPVFWQALPALSQMPVPDSNTVLAPSHSSALVPAQY